MIAIERASVIRDVATLMDDKSFDIFWYLEARTSSVVYAGGCWGGERREKEKGK